MNLDKLNQWLMLTANLGVLVGIIAVVVELRQTQTAMSADASSTRAQMSMHIVELRQEYGDHFIRQKLLNSDELSFDERSRLLRIELSMLRFFENLHYQHEIGVLDEEIWAANSSFISNMCNSASFEYLFPNWPNEEEASRHRASFVQLVTNGCG